MNNGLLRKLAATFIGIALASSLLAQNSADSETVAVESIVSAYHAALSSGDLKGAQSLLLPDALILENGHIETYAEYVSHHLLADSTFAKAVTVEIVSRTISVSGDMAWSATQSTVESPGQAGSVHSVVVELMVLVRRDDGWKIQTIHWSSRPAIEPRGSSAPD
jgi:ketosteroid isomerase-like protein